MRDLDEDASTVARKRVGANGTTMLEIFKDLKRVADDLVRLATLHVDDEADAAGIALHGRIEQALALGALVDFKRAMGLGHVSASVPFE